MRVVESTAHNCKLNYSGSANGVEVASAKQMFQRSMSERKLRYADYYGDGDSKAFLAIENTYYGIKATKTECTGHVQKCVGTRMRKLKRNKNELVPRKSSLMPS